MFCSKYGETFFGSILTFLEEIIANDQSEEDPVSVFLVLTKFV